MPIGDIFCLKLTGELVTVISNDNNGDGSIEVRRPVVSHDEGISHEEESFFPFELETEEAHLAREAQAMILKYKAQRAMQKEMDAIEDAEREAKELTTTKKDLRVN